MTRPRLRPDLAARQRRVAADLDASIARGACQPPAAPQPADADAASIIADERRYADERVARRLYRP